MSRTSAQFILDISSGEKIYMDVFKAACSWNFEAEMQNIVDNSGYDLSPENLKTAYEAPPNWSLALFGGEYFFSEPADLKDKSLFVNPTTEKVIMLDDIQQPDLQAGNDPKYKFTITPPDADTSETYTITFDVGFKINELPSSHTCRGTRESDNKTVKAAQKVPDINNKDACKIPNPKDTGDDTNNPAVIAAWVGLGGAALVSLVFVFVLYKKLQAEAAQAQTAAETASPKDEATLKEKAQKAKAALINAASELKTKIARHWKARETFQYMKLQEMMHPELDVEYASLQRPVDAAIELYLGEYLANHSKIDPNDLNTKDYASTLEEMRQEAAQVARKTFKSGSKDICNAESDRKYGGLAALSTLDDGVYNDPVASMAETVAEQDFDVRDAILRSYTPIVLDGYIQVEIARLAVERGDTYISAANEANQAADKAKSDMAEKEDAKEKIEAQLEDDKISDERRKQLTEERDKLQREINDLKEEVKKQEQRRDEEQAEADKDTEKAKEADKKAAEKRKESSKHGERIFTPKK